MTAEEKRDFVVSMAALHGHRLRRFLRGRVRNAADASDLVQEVYLRLLRVDNHETIRMPEAYLMALANHVLYQHRLRRVQTTELVDYAEPVAGGAIVDESDPAEIAQTQERIRELERALSRLSPKARATLVLHRRDGFSLEEIGARLGVSRAMAKKYLAQALVQCRKRLADDE